MRAIAIAFQMILLLNAHAFRPSSRRPLALSRASQWLALSTAPQRRTLALFAEPAESSDSTVAAAAKNLSLWLVLLLVEPALRVPTYSECVADKGHAACADLLPLLDWAYNHGVQII